MNASVGNNEQTCQIFIFNSMKKLIAILSISLIVFACSHKTTTRTSATIAEMKTSSATVSHEQFMEGKITYEANCARCHALKEPSNYTADEWTKWIDKMAPRAKISEEQKQQIFNYVSVNAKV
jgi:cytochrome c5